MILTPFWWWWQLCVARVTLAQRKYTTILIILHPMWNSYITEIPNDSMKTLPEMMELCLMVEDGAEMPIFPAATFRCLSCQCIYVYHASTRRSHVLSCINPFESFISFHLPRKAQRQTQCQWIIHFVICDFVAISTILDISRNSDNEIGYSDSWKVTMGKVWLCHISKLLCAIQGYWNIGSTLIQ